MADILPLCGAGLESRKKRFRNLFVCRLREKQRDIDVDAVFESLAYSGKSLGRAGDLDHDVRAIHGLPQAPSFRERSVGIEAKKRGNFQTDVTVAPFRFRVNRLEDIARVLHVANCDFLKDAVGVELLRLR